MTPRGVGPSTPHLSVLGTAHPDVEGQGEDEDLAPLLGIAWVVSALRVAGAIVSGAPFNVEATLALVAVLSIPVLVWAQRRA